METESNLQNVVFLNKNSTMDNVQKHNICNNFCIGNSKDHNLKHMVTVYI
jgi:hypothetical protein